MKKLILIFSFLYINMLLLTGQAYDNYIGAGNSSDIIVTSSDADADGTLSINGEGLELDIQGASRFLASTTLGSTIEEIEALTDQGMEAWIDEQIDLPATTYTIPTIQLYFDFYERCVNAIGVDSCSDYRPNLLHWRFTWWQQTMIAQDHLRQRVAMALSEILVLSDQSDLSNFPHGLAAYYDILVNNAFGNFRELMLDVTLNPSMGFYLSHFNNPKAVPMLNINPDENYAREIMQLFSIGLYELNQDGTRKIDPDTGLWIPTYTDDDIRGLAKVFTGLSGSKWENEDNPTPVRFGRRFGVYSKIDPMAMYDEWHQPGPKTIVGDFTIPEGQTGMEDVELAIDHLFNHDNVGPFLAIRLIQRLVKSNPSPAYIERVAGVFASNGQGIRGDMAAVIRAILLDEEAMECYWIEDTKNGMLRAPMLRLTQLLKGLKAETESEHFWSAGGVFKAFTGQHTLSSPTVFNFYRPDYVPDSEFAYLNMTGPEYQILNSSTSSNYVNFMLIALMEDYFRERFDSEFNLHFLNELRIGRRNLIYDDVRPYEARLNDPLWLDLAYAPSEMVDYLDILLANGQLSDETRERITSSASRSDIFDPVTSAHYAVFLLMIDPDYVIMK